MSEVNHSQFEALVKVTIELREEHLRPSKTKAKTKQWDEKITEITSAICALFNSSSGGLLRLTFDDKCLSIKTTQPKIIDDMVRRIEQSVLNFASVSTVSEALKLKDTNAHELQFLVKSTRRFCTTEYHLYLPTDYQVNPITYGDSSEKIAALLKPQGKTIEVNFRDYPKVFYYKEKVPGSLREGQTVQFKLLKDDATSTVTLADRMTSKSNKLVHYISAFANHEGGELYFGIDDTTYTVEGQLANVKERAKIKKRVSNVLSKMVWPVQNPAYFWKIDFVPVLQKQSGLSEDGVRHDTFVIILSVAKCSGGVFVQEPESYYLVNGRVTRIPLDFWMEKIKADSSKCADNPGLQSNMAGKDCWAIAPVQKSINTKRWSSTKQEHIYMTVTQLMENLRNNGNWRKINEVASKVLTPYNTDADLKLTVIFQCIAAAYRQNKHQDAYKFLHSYHSLVQLAKNRAIFEVQELYSWSAIKRSERKYQESYRYTYDALQKMQLIVPGWITAWFLCNAASLLTMFASEEPDPVKKKAWICEAECYYKQALQHAQTITAYKKAAANLRHRVHINLAMLYLASSPNINSMNYNQTISPQHLKSAQESLRAAEDFEGPSMTGFNEFYFLLAKSDLCLRYFQQSPEDNCEQMQKAIRYANNACKVATDNDFAEVLHYAQARITLLQDTPQNDQTATELVDGLLRNLKLSEQ